MPTLDECVGNAELFPVLPRWNYLNHAGMSPLPRPVADAIRTFVDAFQNDGYLAPGVFGEVARLRSAAAKLINADPKQIAILKNTAEAISTVAFGIDWNGGDRIVTTAVEYPANIYPWMQVARRHGAQLVMVPERERAGGTRSIATDELLAAAGHPRCRMIAISHVQFGTGQRMPLEEIGRWCRANGRMFCVDAIQSLGAVPVDVKKMHIDFLAAGSQKWLLGPPGCGILYIAQDWLDRLPPLVVGAYSVVDPDNYDRYDYKLAADAKRHDSGTLPMLSIAGLRAAIDLILSVGVDAVADRIKLATDSLIDRLRRSEFRLASPREDHAWSGIVSFLAPREADLPAIARTVREKHKIEIVVRGGRLRASPHFYNTVEQVAELVSAVESVCSA